MKQFHLPCLAIALLFASCGNNEPAGSASGIDSTVDVALAPPKAEAPPDSATMMKNWQDYMTPGDMQKMIASWDGTWEQEATFWQVPDGPSQTGKTTAVNKTILGGRYQVSNISGNMMGMSFEAMSILSYDNAKKKFQSTWTDNMGTGTFFVEGIWDAATKTITFTGKMVDPSAGDGREMDVREVVRIIDDNTQEIEMYAPGPDGKEFKNMTLRSTRKR